MQETLAETKHPNSVALGGTASRVLPAKVGTKQVRLLSQAPSPENLSGGFGCKPRNRSAPPEAPSTHSKHEHTREPTQCKCDQSTANSNADVGHMSLLTKLAEQHATANNGQAKQPGRHGAREGRGEVLSENLEARECATHTYPE